MADEITIVCSLSAAKDGKSVASTDTSSTSILADMVGEFMEKSYPIVPQAAEGAIPLLGAGAECTLRIKNLDATNFISLRQASGAANMQQVLPGEVALIRLDAACTAPFWIADTADVEVELVVVAK